MSTPSDLHLLPPAPPAAVLRGLPQVQRLLEAPAAQVLCAAYRREQVVQAIRNELALVRQRLLAGGDAAAAGAEAPMCGDAFFQAVG